LTDEPEQTLCILLRCTPTASSARHTPRYVPFHHVPERQSLAKRNPGFILPTPILPVHLRVMPRAHAQVTQRAVHQAQRTRKALVAKHVAGVQRLPGKRFRFQGCCFSWISLLTGSPMASTRARYRPPSRKHPPQPGDVARVKRAKVTSVMLTAELALFFSSIRHHGQDDATRDKIVVSSFCLLTDKNNASSAVLGHP
jgi:hypothetical protein